MRKPESSHTRAGVVRNTARPTKEINLGRVTPRGGIRL